MMQDHNTNNNNNHKDDNTEHLNDETSATLEQQAARVDAAATRALDLVRAYSERDPHDDTDDTNPWRHPEHILEELNRARTEVMQAWESLDQTLLGGHEEKESPSSQPKEDQKEVQDEQLRAAFMDMITDAFGDVLEDLRNSSSDQQQLDVDILVDCLQSGLDLMSQEDREFFLGQDELEEDVTMLGETNLTPHEVRRRELGYHVETAA